MKSKNYLWGILLIAIGVILLIDRTLNIGIFQAVNLWPIFVLVPGLIFEFSYFVSRRNPGLLVPGGILTTIGLLFFFETYTNWNFSQYTWPIYPLAVSIGLFQLYLFDGKQSGLLIPVFILSAVSVISYVLIVSSVFDFTLIFAVFAILAGFYILYKAYFAKK
jgi:hypothetical protein